MRTQLFNFTLPDGTTAPAAAEFIMIEFKSRGTFRQESDRHYSDGLPVSVQSRVGVLFQSGYDPRTMSRLVVAALLLLTLPATIQAADTWTYAESEHFEVYTTGGQRRARDAITYFERVHAFFADVLKLAPVTKARTRLIVFSGDKQFAPYRPSEFTAAFYQAGADRDHIVMRSLDAEAYPVVVHEYAHLVIRQAPAVYPLWLNEGLAEFYSTLEPEGNRMSIGKVPQHRLAYINQGVGLMDLERLFAVSHTSPEYSTRSHAGVFYSQSWALTHMLLTDQRYRGTTGAFMELIEKGVSSAEAMSTAYGRTPESVGRDLANYVRQSQYIYYLAPYTSPAAVRNRPTRTVDPFEADLVTAHLLSNMRERAGDARSIYERLAGERPDDLQLIEARAYFELRHGDSEAARPYLKRAVEVGSRAAFVYRNYAMVEPQRAEELLARAIEIAPEDVEARLHYATLLLNGDRTDQAATILESARGVPQERRFAFFQLLANTYMRLNRLEDGRGAADLALRHAEPGSEEAYARGLITAIAEFARARALAAERAEARSAVGAPPAPEPSDLLPDARLEPAPYMPGLTGQRETTIAVRGRMRNMVCGTGDPVIEVETEAGLLRLTIDDPGAVTVVGPEGGVVDLHCGAQDAAVRVGYLPAIGGDTAGRVRVLDYRVE